MLMYSILFSAITHLQNHLSLPVQKMRLILDVPLMDENIIIFVK